MSKLLKDAIEKCSNRTPFVVYEGRALSAAGTIAANLIKAKDEIDMRRARLTNELKQFYGDADAKAIVALYVECLPKLWKPIEVADAIRQAAYKGQTAERLLFALRHIANT